MKVFLAAVILVAFCVAIMCVGILFGRKFPSSDVDDNPELKKRGISCYRHEDARLQGRGNRPSGVQCDGNYSASCKGCAFFDLEKQTRQ